MQSVRNGVRAGDATLFPSGRTPGLGEHAPPGPGGRRNSAWWILDPAPVIPVADGLVLASLADATLLAAGGNRALPGRGRGGGQSRGGRQTGHRGGVFGTSTCAVMRPTPMATIRPATAIWPDLISTARATCSRARVSCGSASENRFFERLASDSRTNGRASGAGAHRRAVPVRLQSVREHGAFTLRGHRRRARRHDRVRSLQDVARLREQPRLQPIGPPVVTARSPALAQDSRVFASRRCV